MRTRRLALHARRRAPRATYPLVPSYDHDWTLTCRSCGRSYVDGDLRTAFTAFEAYALAGARKLLPPCCPAPDRQPLPTKLLDPYCPCGYTDRDTGACLPCGS